MNSAFIDYYRCPDSFADFRWSQARPTSSGYFRFGRNVVCYGQCAGISPRVSDNLYDALTDVSAQGNTVWLPFDPTEIVTSLRYERYISATSEMRAKARRQRALRHTYYQIRPLLPLPVRKHLQRIQLRDWKEISFPGWPVDLTVESIFEKLLTLLLKSAAGDRIPFIWFWPDGFPSCAMMTHDVETLTGRDFCTELMDLNDAFGIKASFQIIPERRYPVTHSLIDEIRGRGFEIGIHDLNHDGHLFGDRERFLFRAERINRYAEEYGAAGFRAGALYHNLDWYGALNFSYDMSVPNVGHLEAQRGGCCSVTPFSVGKLLELPVTMTQDYSLFHILNDYSINLWKCQIHNIMEHHGLASFITHPDYLVEGRAQQTYKSLLAHLVALRSQANLWIALPGQVNKWWRARSQMKLTRQGPAWVVEGPESHRARVAYASLDGDRLNYELEPHRHGGGSAAEEHVRDEVSARTLPAPR